MTPHFLFGCAEKKTAVHGQKKRRLGAKPAPMAPFCFNTGVVVVGAVQTCQPVPGALYPGKTENCFPASVGLGAAFGGRRMASASLSALPASLSAAVPILGV